MDTAGGDGPGGTPVLAAVADLAVAARMSFREVADLDEDEFYALRDAVIDRRETDAWDQSTELLATLVDEIAALRAELSAGLPVIQVKKQRHVDQPRPYPRPKPEGEVTEIIVRPGELARMLRDRKVAA